MLCASCSARLLQNKNSVVKNAGNTVGTGSRMRVFLSNLYNQRMDELGEREQVEIMKRNEDGIYVPTVMPGGSVFQWKTNPFNGNKERINVGSYVDYLNGVHWYTDASGDIVPLQPQ